MFTLFFEYQARSSINVVFLYLARLFHELNQAYELLLDPLRRLAIDATLRVKAARKARFSTFDGKRKAMQEELEERERAFNKKAKMEKRDEEVKVWHETERIKEEGRRMREEREKEAARKLAEAEVAKKAGDDTEDDAVPKLGTSEGYLVPPRKTMD